MSTPITDPSTPVDTLAPPVRGASESVSPISADEDVCLNGTTRYSMIPCEMVGTTTQAVVLPTHLPNTGAYSAPVSIIGTACLLIGAGLMRLARKKVGGHR